MINRTAAALLAATFLLTQAVPAFAQSPTQNQMNYHLVTAGGGRVPSEGRAARSGWTSSAASTSTMVD